jgi:hypothetical protein
MCLTPVHENSDMCLKIELCVWLWEQKEDEKTLEAAEASGDLAILSSLLVPNCGLPIEATSFAAASQNPTDAGEARHANAAKPTDQPPNPLQDATLASGCSGVTLLGPRGEQGDGPSPLKGLRENGGQLLNTSVIDASSDCALKDGNGLAADTTVSDSGVPLAKFCQDQEQD